MADSWSAKRSESRRTKNVALFRRKKTKWKRVKFRKMRMIPCRVQSVIDERFFNSRNVFFGFLFFLWYFREKRSWYCDGVCVCAKVHQNKKTHTISNSIRIATKRWWNKIVYIMPSQINFCTDGVRCTPCFRLQFLHTNAYVCLVVSGRAWIYIKLDFFSFIAQHWHRANVNNRHRTVFFWLENLLVNDWRVRAHTTRV